MINDPTLPSLQAQTEAGVAVALPWSREEKPLLTGFDSTKMRDYPDGPWIPTVSPFSAQSIVTATMVPDPSGGVGVYREGFSTRSESSHEHLSASLGITVGYSFLNVNVTGEYDSTVDKTSNVRSAPARRTGFLTPTIPISCAIPETGFPSEADRWRSGYSIFTQRLLPVGSRGSRSAPGVFPGSRQHLDAS